MTLSDSETAALPQSKLARRLKAHEQGLYNCACSVVADQRFVHEICSLYALPAHANLRCGLWYLPEAQRRCYFKSTDGHTGNWGFSSTRLNLHVALTAAQAGGCVVVDATRRGKTFPVRAVLLAGGLRVAAVPELHLLQDALTKTIPIWAAVLNQAVARILPKTDWDADVHLPLWVSASEQQQIRERLASWVHQLLQVRLAQLCCSSALLH